MAFFIRLIHAARQLAHPARAGRRAAPPRARAGRRAAPPRARRRLPSAYSSPRPMAQPTSQPWSRHASANQPSRTLTLSAPLAAAFMPLVPLASSGRRGVLSHTSTPAHQRARDAHVVVLDEDDAARGGPRSRLAWTMRANELLAALVLRVRLAREDELHGPLGVARAASSRAPGREKRSAARL